MKTSLEGKPVFGHLHVELNPGESIVAEAGAMASMSMDLTTELKTNGGIVSAFLKLLFGRESFFINRFINRTGSTQGLTISPRSPGDVREASLNNGAFCLQPGAYLASTDGVRLGLQWAGINSWIAGEGLFRLILKGTGKIWYSAYGAMILKHLSEPMIIDSGHIVAYEPSVRLRNQLSGGLFSSLFGGEGIVTRLEGQVAIVLQTRSVRGLVSFLNPKLPR